jgi:molybdopterin-guanine dinucleotide biosynthesis protein A
MNYNKFSGFVLAGGKSSRMKADKAFLEINGETFLKRAVKSLSPVCENRIKVVLNQTQTHFIKKLPKGTAYIFDIYENRGALGGIHAVLENCQSDWAIILACDLPFVTGEAIVNLQQIALSSNESSAIVPKQSDGRLQPLCAVYQVHACLPIVGRLLRENDSVSMRDFLKLVPMRVVEFNELTTDIDLFFNVNYHSDYENLILSSNPNKPYFKTLK